MDSTAALSRCHCCIPRLRDTFSEHKESTNNYSGQAVKSSLNLVSLLLPAEICGMDSEHIETKNILSKHASTPLYRGGCNSAQVFASSPGSTLPVEIGRRLTEYNGSIADQE